MAKAGKAIPGVAEFGAAVGAKYNALSAGDRAKYDGKAKTAASNYEKQMAAWKKSDNAAKYAKALADLTGAAKSAAPKAAKSAKAPKPAKKKAAKKAPKVKKAAKKPAKKAGKKPKKAAKKSAKKK
jgi:hypothetical protein